MQFSSFKAEKEEVGKTKMTYQIYAYIVEKSAGVSPLVIGSVQKKEAVCLYTPQELPLSPPDFSPQLKLRDSIFYEVWYCHALNKNLYREEDLLNVTPKYVVPSFGVDLLPKWLSHPNLSFEWLVKYLSLTLDNDLSQTKEAAFQVARGREEKKEYEQKKEERRRERLEADWRLQHSIAETERINFEYEERERRRGRMPTLREVIRHEEMRLRYGAGDSCAEAVGTEALVSDFGR